MPNPYALNELRRLASRFTTDDPDDLASNPGGSIDTNIALASPPAPPPFKYRPTGPPLVSRGGDMAPSLDQGVPAFSGASVLMSAPPGEKVTYDEQPAPRTSLYTGGGNMRGNSALDDVDVQRYLLNNQFAGEAQDRIISSQRAQAASYGMADPARAQRTAQTYGGEADALKNLLTTYQQDISESPITRGIAENVDYQQREQAAKLAGFLGLSGKTPIQEEAEYGRRVAEEKMRQPLEIEKSRAAGQVGAAEATARGTIEAAKQRATSYESRTSAQLLANMDKNLTAIKVAQARNPMALQAIAAAERAKDLIRQGMATGRIAEDDPQALNQLTAIDADIRKYMSPTEQTQAPTDAPDITGLAPGHGRTFQDGPFAGQTWTAGLDGQPHRVK